MTDTPAEDDAEGFDGDIGGGFTYEDCTSLGIAVVASAFVDRTRVDVAPRVVNSFLDDGVDPAALFVGLVNISQLLLLRVEEVTGTDALVELELIAAQVEADKDGA